jgi:hypothetical protein
MVLGLFTNQNNYAKKKVIQTRINLNYRPSKLGPSVAFYYPNIRTTFFPINKNNSFPLEIALSEFDPVIYEVDPDQIPRASLFNFAVIRDPLTRSISLADSLYYCDLTEKHNVQSDFKSMLNDPKMTKKLWKEWNNFFYLQDFGDYSDVAVGHLGKQVWSLPRNWKINLISFDKMKEIPRLLGSNLKHLTKTQKKKLMQSLETVCTDPWFYDVDAYQPEIENFTNTFYKEDMVLWNRVKEQGIIYNSLNGLNLTNG